MIAMKFIYVFNKEARDAMLSLGLKLLKEDRRNQIYIFENSERMCFSRSDFYYMVSDTLTF